MILSDEGTPAYYAGTVVDITERIAAEQALRDSEERYRNLVDNLAEGVFQVAADGKYISVNSALADMLGYDSPDELLTTAAQQRYVDPDLGRDFVGLLMEKGFVEGYEVALYRKSGDQDRSARRRSAGRRRFAADRFRPRFRQPRQDQGIDPDCAAGGRRAWHRPVERGGPPGCR